MISQHKILVALALAVFASGGCRCERDGHKPYTPFGVATSLEDPLAHPPVDDARDAGASSDGAFKPVEAAELVPPSASVSVGSWRLRALSGRLISHYLVLHSDQPQQPEVVAWLVPQAGAESGQPPGELWWFKENDSSEKLSGFPGFVPTGSSCSHRIALSQTGPNTVTLDVSADCPTGTIPRAPVRSISVLAPHGTPRQLLQLRLAAPHADEHLSVVVDSTDRDGDGRDDVAAHFTLGVGADQPHATVPFVWLERAAGLSRDFSEPTRSFRDIGSVEVVRAKGRTTSKEVPARVEAARRLFAMLCRQGGVYRITDRDGNAFRCGDLTEAFSWYVEAEVQAALTQRQFSSALLAYERADWYGFGPSARSRAATAEKLRQAIGTTPVELQRVPVRAMQPNVEPRLSPLRFGLGSTLFILTPDGVVQWRGGRLEDASEEMDPWPLLVFSPDGQRLTSVSYPCDRPTVELQSQTPEGRLEVALRTPFFAPRPGLCQGNADFYRPPLRPVAWSAEGLTTFFGPVRLGVAARFRSPGAPVSANGKHFVVPTSIGLYVEVAGEPSLWETGTHVSTLTDCVIDDHGTRVACLDGRRGVALIDHPKVAPTAGN